MRHKILVSILAGLLSSANSFASSATVTTEPSGDSYHFVTHYRIHIDAPKEKVWPILVDLKSWMYEFELTTLSGNPGQAGQVLLLYPEQEFRVQVTKAIPNEMMTIVNLPMTFRKEHATGMGVMTLHSVGSGTEFSLTMSRRYTWDEPEPNPLKATRTSEAFHERTRAMWQDRFLMRLKKLAEET